MTQDRTEIYIGGAWVAPSGSETIEVENPTTEEIIATVPSGTAQDVDAAVAAAADALPGWAGLPVAERADYLMRLHEALTERQEEIARTISTEMGSPIKFSATVQTMGPIMNLKAFAGLADTFTFEEEIGNSLVVKEPMGVVAAITPWNYPLNQVTSKLGGALIAGNTIVLKPSEVTPLSAYLLFDAIHEVGFPPGVLNLVPGYGPVVGEALAAHPDVDMVSFTGSTAAGRRVAVVGAETIKKVSLELGGKSACVILPDADLAKAVKVGMANAFMNGGQTCIAWTRMLVHRDQYEEAVQLAAAAAETYTPGDPFDDATRIGPMVSGKQRDRIRDYINKGIEEGARLVTGGAEAPEGLDRGYYVRPTVLADVKPNDTVAQEEIFGPVLSMIPYGDEDEAAAIANNSTYGLSGAVWAGDTERATAFARRIRTGAVDVNGGRFNVLAPMGGFKQSGVGRENGPYGIEEFLQTKAIQR
ncbi:MAG: aldehyde dehydrogenase family protein [Jatrophihabitans sp.]